MRPIFLFLIAVALWFGRFFRYIAAVLVDKSGKLFMRVVESVDSQVDEIRSVFARKPCSATGGTA